MKEKCLIIKITKFRYSTKICVYIVHSFKIYASLFQSLIFVISGSCDFEKDTCSYQNLQTDDFDWLRHRGRSASASTGPSTDHTKGTSLGYYMYIETSNPRVAGNKARFVSEVFPPKQTGSCYVFWYHMYGADVDTLNIYILLNQTSDTISTEALLWQQKGDNGDVWQNGQMNIPTKYTAKPYQVQDCLFYFLEHIFCSFEIYTNNNNIGS